jgi:D-alanyl-D-alanine carboxypeptidase (penicillin-binding protein 5/6)
MNDKARALGALDTHAITPSGLDARGQLTSAYDLALIARACWSNPAFVKYVTARAAQIPKQKPHWPAFQIQNSLGFLYNYRGSLGGKSGFSDVAGHTFVGVGRRNGQRLVVAMLDVQNPGYGWDQASQLLDWGFDLGGDPPVGRLVAPGDPNPYQAFESPQDARPVARPAVAADQSVLGRLHSGVNAIWPLLAMMAIVLAAGAILALLVRYPHNRPPARGSAA